MTPTVTILTYCAHPSLAYGTLLVFKNLRTGFPTARVEVYENGSHPEVREHIVRASADVGASFEALPPKHYADHFRTANASGAGAAERGRRSTAGVAHLRNQNGSSGSREANLWRSRSRGTTTWCAP